MCLYIYTYILHIYIYMLLNIVLVQVQHSLYCISFIYLEYHDCDIYIYIYGVEHCLTDELRQYKPSKSPTVMKHSGGESERGCSSCGGSGWVLHKLWQKATFRNLCTNCVLINSPGLFCPLCLHVYDHKNIPPLRNRLMCLKCPSITHLSCSVVSPASSPSSFLCPPCSDPLFLFFNLTPSSKRIEVHDRDDHDRPDDLFIDKDNAKALLAASRIAAASMTKAAIASRADAERRVEEALAAKIRAKDALQKLAYLLAKDKHKNDNETDPKIGIAIEPKTTCP